MKYLPLIGIIGLLGLFGLVSQHKLGATIISTNSSDTLETFRTNVNTSLTNINNALSLTQSQVLYSTGGGTIGSIATSAPSLSSAFSYTGTLGYFINGSSGTLKSVGNIDVRYIATTTTLFGTTTIPVEVGYGDVFNTAKCYTDKGTLNVQIGYGTASTTMFSASTAVSTATFSSNNTMTAGNKVVMDIGTPASSVAKIVCTINYTF